MKCCKDNVKHNEQLQNKNTKQKRSNLKRSAPFHEQNKRAKRSKYTHRSATRKSRFPAVNLNFKASSTYKHTTHKKGKSTKRKKDKETKSTKSKTIMDASIDVGAVVANSVQKLNDAPTAASIEELDDAALMLMNEEQSDVTSAVDVLSRSSKSNDAKPRRVCFKSTDELLQDAHKGEVASSGQYHAQKPDHIYCTCCCAYINVVRQRQRKYKISKTPDFTPWTRHCKRAPHKRALQSNVHKLQALRTFKCRGYRPSSDWQILLAKSMPSELKIALFEKTVTSGECLGRTIYRDACCAKCRRVLDTKCYLKKLRSMRKLVARHSLPNIIDMSVTEIVEHLIRFANLEYGIHNQHYSALNEDIESILRSTANKRITSRVTKSNDERQKARYKTELDALTTAVRQGNLSRIFAVMRHKFKLLAGVDMKTAKEKYVTPVFEAMFESYFRVLDAKSPQGFRRNDITRKLWMVLQHTSPKAARLMRQLLGITFVPSKSGIHKTSVRAVGVGVFTSMISSINDICRKYDFAVHDSAGWKPGLVSVQFDGTALNGVVKWIAKLQSAVGFSDWWNDEANSCDDYDAIQNQFKDRLVAEDVLIFMWTPATYKIPPLPIAMFPYHKEHLKKNDVNFLVSKVLHCCRSYTALSKMYMISSDALSCQSALIEALADPRKRLCTLLRDECLKKHNCDNVTFADSSISAKCDGFGYTILPTLENVHVLKRNYRSIGSKASLLGEGFVFHHIFAEAAASNPTNTLCDSVVWPTDTQDADAARAMFSQPSRQAMSGVQFNKCSVIFSWLTHLSFEISKNSSMDTLLRMRYAGMIRTVWSYIEETQAFHKRQKTLCDKYKIPDKLILHNVFLCDQLAIYTLGHLKFYGALPYEPGLVLETACEKFNSIIRRWSKEFSVGSLVHEMPKIIETTKILDEMESLKRTSKRKLIYLSKLTSKDILNALREGKEKWASVVIKLLGTHRSESMIKSMSVNEMLLPSFQEQLKQEGSWDWNQTAMMKMQVAGKNKTKQFESGAEPPYLLIKASSSCCPPLSPKHHTARGSLTEKQAQAPEQVELEANEAVWDDLCQDLVMDSLPPEQRLSIADVWTNAAATATNPECDHTQPINSKNTTRSPSKHSTVSSVISTSSVEQTTRDIITFCDAIYAASDIEHASMYTTYIDQLKAIQSSQDVVFTQKKLDQYLTMLQLCKSMFHAEFELTPLVKYASNVKRTKSKFVNERNYCLNDDGSTFMTKDAAFKKAAIAFGFTVLPYQRDRLSRVKGNGWASKKATYDFDKSDPDQLLLPRDWVTFYDPHGELRMGQILQMHSQNKPMAMNIMSDVHGVLLLLITGASEFGRPVLLKENTQRIRLVRMKHVHRKVSNVSQLSFYSISTLPLLPLTMWKEDWKVQKALSKRHKPYHCPHCKKGYVRPTSFQKHVANCTKKSLAGTVDTLAQSTPVPSLMSLDILPTTVAPIFAIEVPSFADSGQHVQTAAPRNTPAIVPSSSPVGDARISGLRNLGNTCFMNAAIQCLIRSPHVHRYLSSMQFQADINPNNVFGHNGNFIRAVARIFADFEWNRIPNHNPRSFWNVVRSINDVYCDYRQHDAYQFLEWMLDTLHEDVNRFNSIQSIPDVFGRTLFDRSVAESAWNTFLRTKDSFFIRTFFGQQSSSIRCMRSKCGAISTKYEPFSMLIVRIPGPHTTSDLGSCLKEYTRMERLDWNKCGRCVLKSPLLFGYVRTQIPHYSYDLSVSTSLQFVVRSKAGNEQTMSAVRNNYAIIATLSLYYDGKVPAVKKLNLLRAPETLTIVLSRFDQSRAGKKYTYVSFPVDGLDLTDVMALHCNEQVPPYDLSGITNHHSTSAHGGHYTAHVKHVDSQRWYHMDDTTCTRVSNLSELITSSAYILTYSKRVASAEPVQISMSTKFRSILRAAPPIYIGGNPLSTKVLRRLDYTAGPRQNTWLNDEIVNAALHLLQSRNTKIWIATSFFYTLLTGKTSSEFLFEAVKRYTKTSNLRKKGIDAHTIFGVSRWLIPVNWKNQHWILLVGTWKSTRITVLDSLLGSIAEAELKQIARNVIRYARLECNAKALSAGVADVVNRKWTVSIKNANEYTQQSNVNDCGVRMLRAAELIAEGKIPHIAEGEMTKERADLLTLLVNNDFGMFTSEEEEGQDDDDDLIVI